MSILEFKLDKQLPGEDGVPRARAGTIRLPGCLGKNPMKF